MVCGYDYQSVWTPTIGKELPCRQFFILVYQEIGYRLHLNITYFTLLGVEVIVLLASLTLFSVQPRHASKESKTKHCRRTQARILTSPSFRTKPSSVEPDNHYPLTCTPENSVWMLGKLSTCRFLPLPGSEANLVMFYEDKKSMSMISWSRKGTQHYLISPLYFLL